MPQWIFWEDNISFVVFGAVYRPSFRVDYTERRKTERKNVSNEHYITGPPQREEILRERKIKRFLNFIKVCHNEFLRGQHKFCSFWSCVPTFSTMLKKIVLNHCLNWRKVNTAISDFIQSIPIQSKSILKF